MEELAGGARLAQQALLALLDHTQCQGRCALGDEVLHELAVEDQLRQQRKDVGRGGIPGYHSKSGQSRSQLAKALGGMTPGRRETPWSARIPYARSNVSINLGRTASRFSAGQSMK